MKVAAFQAPLLPAGTMPDLTPVVEHVRWCEAHGVRLLCCPEAFLGGLADYAPDPSAMAFDVSEGRLTAVLAPLAGPVAIILGFTERDGTALYNSAAVLHHGQIVGVYRKRHPAVRRSIHRAGTDLPVFALAGLTFGIQICHDSTFAEDARHLVALGAQVLFVPTNNALPRDRADLADAALASDRARAQETGRWIVRSDMAGTTEHFASRGSTSISAPDGQTVGALSPYEVGLVVADISVGDALVGRPKAS